MFPRKIPHSQLTEDLRNDLRESARARAQRLLCRVLETLDHGEFSVSEIVEHELEVGIVIGSVDLKRSTEEEEVRMNGVRKLLYLLIEDGLAEIRTQEGRKNIYSLTEAGLACGGLLDEEDEE